MLKILLIAGGGALGSVSRYLLAGWVQRWSEGAFPVGTLAVNLLGCFVLGLAAALLMGPAIVREEYRMAFTIGFLGGFTTFSTFGYETFALLNDRQWKTAALNVLLSNGLGILGVWVGYRLGEKGWGG